MDQQHFESNSLSIGAQKITDESAAGDRTGLLGAVVCEQGERGTVKCEASLVRIVHPWELQRCACPEPHKTIQIKDEELPRCFECLKPQDGKQKEKDEEKMKYDQGDEG